MSTIDLDVERYLRNMTVMKQLRPKLAAGAIKFDWNGHYRGRCTSPRVPADYQYEFRRDFYPEESLVSSLRGATVDLQAVPALLDSPGERFVALPAEREMARCSECGDKLFMEFNGNVLRVTTKCRYPKGVPSFRTKIAVPSGVLVFANIFDCVEPPDSSESSAMMVSLRSSFRHYAALGVPTGACGNSCPGVFAKDDTLVIGNEYFDMNSDDWDTPKKTFKGFKRLGQIVTDAWQWQCSDRDRLAQLARKAGQKPQSGLLKVRVRPGIYSVVDRWHRKDWDAVKDVKPFATIRRVADLRG